MVGILVILLLVHLVCSSFAIEIFDQKFGIHYTHTIGSHFGQSLSLYSSSDGNAVLVGAPLDTIPAAMIGETGNTLNCEIDLTAVNVSNCRPLDLLDILKEDLVGSVEDQTPLEEKKGMLMGSTLYSSPVSGQIITCAPLYKISTKEPLNLPVGLCHVLERLNSTSEIVSPCKKNNCGFSSDLTFGYCMAGFSSTFFSDGQETMISGPGRGYFQGAGYKGRDAGCSDSTTPMDQLSDYGYIGYTVATGRIYSRVEDTIITSSPRSKLSGILRTYSNSTTVHGTVSITERGSIFGTYGTYLGYSMVAMDIDGDGLDEILASEPLYSDYDLRMVEIGRVVVIGVNNVTDELEVRFNFTSPDPVPYSRFGTAMTVIGDLDEDGYPEIAISAPFSPSGGTVYIYKSSESGFDTVPIQTLQATDYMPIGAKLKSFGFSLSSQADIDGNGYEDLLIGAPLSDHVLLVRSHRLVRIDAIFSSSIEVVNLKSVGKCQIDVDGSMKEFGCLDVSFDFSYEGWPSPASIVLDVNISIDLARLTQGLRTRGSFLEGGVFVESVRESITLSQATNQIVTKTVYLSESIFHLSSPLEFIADFDVAGTMDRDYFSSPVIIDPVSRQSQGVVQLVNVNCGSDNRCDPILQLTAGYSFVPDKVTNQIPESLTPGRAREFYMRLEVGNTGEEAYGPRIRFLLTNQISFRSTNTSIVTDIHIIDNELILSIGNTIEQDEMFVVVVVFTSTVDVPDQPFLSIEIEFFSDNLFGDSEYASKNFSLQIPIRTEINIISNAVNNLKETTHKAENSFIPLAANSNQDVNIVGSNSLHHYTVTNLGPWSGSAELRLTLTIYWPIGNLLSNEFYLYLTGIQVTRATCEEFHVNKLSFLLHDFSSRRRRSNHGYMSKLIRRVRETILPTTTEGNINFDCRETPENCVKIQCFIDPLGVGESSNIQLYSNIFEPTLTKYSPYGVWNLTSFAKLNVTSSANVIVLFEENAFVATLAQPDETGAAPGAPAWYVYVIPTVILVVLMIVVAIIILYIVECLRAKKKKREHKPLHDATLQDQEDVSPGEEN